jgi:hypothetical protein
MTSYSDLLKDPRWQRKRLESLEAAGWACARCGDKETTLHVHHRQYIKGRKPWEYTLAELQVLCAPCHEGHHEFQKKLNQLVEGVDPCSEDVLLAVIAGYLCASLEGDHGYIESARQSDPVSFVCGGIAGMLRGGGDDPLKAAVTALRAEGRVLNPGEEEVLRRAEEIL